MLIRVLYHDNCFDGAASAAVFSKFVRDKISPNAELSYAGLSHKAGGAAIDPTTFQGDENAIVDFRYSQNSRLTWWFDHHQSAFQQPGDEEHFRSDKSGKKFHDPNRKSCTKYIADITQSKFGFDPSSLSDLVQWAETIDGAQFESPTMAVELAEPALQLMTVLEANQDPQFIPRVIELMQTTTLADIVRRPEVQKALGPLMDKHRRAIELVRKKAQLEKGVVFFDIADDGLDGVNKFISYYLYPNARYTVWVGGSSHRSKVSIGSNPWLPHLRTHNLAQIAERFGGGGHSVVAAISFGANDLLKARQAANQVVTELRG